MPQAKKTDKHESDELAEHLERASAATPLSGWAKIAHALELAFVHGLAGAEDDARELIDDAKAEFAKYEPNLSHLEAEFSLAVARILAALQGK